MELGHYLLDTSVCINLLRSNAPNFIARLAQVGVATCCNSEITLAELRVGAESSRRPLHQHELIDELAATFSTLLIGPAIRTFAREKARLQASGQTIDSFDLLIGATAMQHSLVMVTNNTKHFQRLPLALEDWTLPPSPERLTR